MKHTTRITVSVIAIVVVAALCGAGPRSQDPRRSPDRDVQPESLTADVIEAADRARGAEIEAAKAMGGGSPQVIPAAGFSTNGNHEDTYYFAISDGYLQGSAGTDGCVKAPAYFPQGAHITGVYASIVDDDGSQDVYVELMRSDTRAYHSASAIASLNTSGASTTVQTPSDVSISEPDVSYPDYIYWVQTCLPSADTRLFSVRIYFTEPAPDVGIFSDDFESGNTGAWSVTVN